MSRQVPDNTPALEKTPQKQSALDRINAMNQAVQQLYWPAPISSPTPSQPTSPQNTKQILSCLDTTSTKHSLFAQYENALFSYLNSVSYSAETPCCLCTPLAYFYARKNYKKHIFAMSSFPFGDYYTKKVSKRTFPSLLRNCEIPDGSANLRNALFDALFALVRNYPYNERELLTQKLILMDPGFIQYLHLHLYVSKGNLFFLPMNTIVSRGNLFTTLPVLSNHFFVPHTVNKNVLCKYLSCVSKSPQGEEDQSHRELTLPAKSILFRGNLSSFQLLTYESGFSSFEFSEPFFPTKTLSYQKPPAQVPPVAATWLFHLTGGDTVLTDGLARLLARAANPSPGKDNITIICSRANPNILRTFFSEVLSSLILTPNYIPSQRIKGSLPSLNQFCRSGGLLQLYRAQGCGQGVALVRDTEITHTARPVLDKLLSGKAVKLNVPHCPPQYLYNKTYFICISQDPQRAKALSQTLNADLMDLSSTEIPLLDPSAFSMKDIAWLRSVFLPYGLVSPQKTAKQKKPPAPSDWVFEFLSEYCSTAPNVKCHREPLYKAYSAFYRHTHPGLEPPLSQGQLVKAVKLHLGEGAFKNVNYCKIRSEQKMYFVGLSCPVDLPAPAPIPTQPHTDAFTTHLEHIHSMQPKISLQPYEEIQVKVISSPVE